MSTLTPGRNPATDPSTNITKAQLGEPMSFIRVLTGIWVLGYLQEQKCKAHYSTGDSSQRLGTWSPLHSLQAAQQPGGSFPRDSCLNLFQAAQLCFCFFQVTGQVLESFLQVGLSENDSQQVYHLL